jgi:hypothetical protein
MKLINDFTIFIMRRNDLWFYNFIKVASIN